DRLPRSSERGVKRMVSRRRFARGAWAATAAIAAIAAIAVTAPTESVAQAPSAAPPVGDQHAEYVFPPTGETLPYRFYVPTTWDRESALPILLFLHGAGA